MQTAFAALAALIVITPASLAASSDQDEAVAQYVQESRGAVKAFGPRLKGELQKAMKSGGPINALEVCNLQAPEIADAVSDELQLSIGRTSLRVRNPDNAPDPWELAVLERFEQRKAAGEDPATMEYSEIVENAEGTRFRYMKAIKTGEVCLACHGNDIKPEVVTSLDQLYPQDQARGFELGDIRGAFTVSRKVD